MMDFHASAPAPVRLDPQSLAEALNAPQLEAVTHAPGAQLILAGAGSGKTRVLTYKIAWLIKERGYRPWEILAVTFTNKAAAEMRTRIGQILGPQGSPGALRWVGTFHSICARLLRFHATRLGFTSSFSIYDTDDQKRFVKNLLKAENLEDDMRFSDDKVRHYISRNKNSGVSPNEAKLMAEDRDEERMARLYARYQDDLKKNNGMDFDDLIFMAIRLLEEIPEVRQAFVDSFRYILIDEYQDTNRAQYKLIRLLVGSRHNLVVVGDDDQSIYGWRGADITNILSFQKDFPEARVTRLEQNYRSTANILAVANSVIRNNKQRMEKRMWTSNGPGEKIGLAEMEDEILEAGWVARRIREELAGGAGPGGLGTKSFRAGDIAVFYRTNSQSRVLEDELRRQRIPYLIVGGIRFYERKEVKDLLAYLRVLANPRDEVALARIVNVPKRGIGEKSVQQVQEHAFERGIPLLEALSRAADAGVNSGTAKRMGEFVSQLAALRALVRAGEPLPSLIAEIITRTGYKAHLEEEATDESLDRLANIEELVSAAQDFLRRRAAGEAGTPEGGAGEAGGEGAPGAYPGRVPGASGASQEDLLAGAWPAANISPSADAPAAGGVPAFSGSGAAAADGFQDLDLFLQEISLVSDADSLKESKEAVVLMTVHSAKGLEFPRVFVTGLEDGLFPMLRNDDDGDLEEERRLFYVAVTRARQTLTLTYARRRRRYGMYQESIGSRFFREIDRAYLDVARPAPAQRAQGSGGFSGYGGYGGAYGRGAARGGYGGGPGSGRIGGDASGFVADAAPSYEDYSQEEGPGFRKGQKVKHDKFGVGTVMGASGHGEEVRVEIVFGDHIRRTLMAKFAKLQPLD